MFLHWDAEAVRLRLVMGTKPPLAVAWVLAHRRVA